jgi:hypothetical protein
MIVRCLVVTTMMALAAGSALAQTARPPTPPQPAAPTRAAQPPAAPAPAAPPARPRPQGQPINIKIDATITDQQGTSPAVKKTVSVVAADASNGSVRTNATFPAIGPVPLNMDAEPTLLSDGKIRVSLRLQYDLPSPATLGRNAGGEERQPQRTSIQESLTLVLENGKSVVAAQSADPVSDRQVTLEVRATILR